MLAHNGVLKAKWEVYVSKSCARQDFSDRQGDRVGKIAARYVNISVRRQVFASVKVALCQDDVVITSGCLEYARPLQCCEATVKTQLCCIHANRLTLGWG